MSKVEFFKSADCLVTHMGETAQGRADYFNRILAERGTRVMRCEDSLASWWREDDQLMAKVTHTGLLVDVQPIAKDTAEGLLREMVGHIGSVSSRREDFLALYERAKRLLDQPRQSEG
jgi:hypothetical protein